MKPASKTKEINAEYRGCGKISPLFLERQRYNGHCSESSQ